jgi:hypothetical protein
LLLLLLLLLLPLLLCSPHLPQACQPVLSCCTTAATPDPRPYTTSRCCCSCAGSQLLRVYYCFCVFIVCMALRVF